MGFMSPNAPGAPPPPPPPPPTDLRQVDAELAKLGYKDPQTAGQEGTINGISLSKFGAPPLSSRPGMSPVIASMMATLPTGRANTATKNRVNELLGYRTSFNAADESVRTTGGKGRASTILAGAAAAENQKNEPLASRVLLKAY